MSVSFLTNKLLHYRGVAGVLTVASVVGMCFAYFYLQGVQKLDPCPLCIFQRVGLIVMGIFAFGVFIQSQGDASKSATDARGAARYVVVGGRGSSSCLDTAFTTRSSAFLWHGLDYWMDTLPIAQVFKEVFKGSGECAVIDWTFLGFSIPEMSLAFFGVLLLLIVWAMRQAKFP